MNISDKLPITAVVVTCNEASRLPRCLESLNFCDEILVCDLQSTDSSAEIGQKLAHTFLQKPRVDFVELIWPDLFALARNDWILRFDPDQVMPYQLEKGIREKFSELEDSSCIHLPLLYYFLNVPLFFSVWGKVRYFPLLFNRNKIKCSGTVHSGIQFDAHSSQLTVNKYEEHAIKHYWVDSIGQMMSKHLRYLRHEGSSRISNGIFFSWKRLRDECLSSYQANFIDGGCYKSGWRGFFLGFFHLIYVFLSNFSLAIASLRYKLKAKLQ